MRKRSSHSPGRVSIRARCTAAALVFVASLCLACGGSSDDPPPATPDNWDQMSWDQGHWQ